MTIELDLIQTTGLAVLIYMLGRWIKTKVSFFRKYFIRTPNAVANMSAVIEKNGPAPTAWFVLPVVTVIFINICNPIIITFFINLLK